MSNLREGCDSPRRLHLPNWEIEPSAALWHSAVALWHVFRYSAAARQGKGAFKVAEFEIEVALERFKVTLKYLAVP